MQTAAGWDGFEGKGWKLVKNRWRRTEKGTFSPPPLSYTMLAARVYQLSKQSDIQQVYGVFTSTEEVNINKMFAFFSKKKHSPDSSDEGAPIPGPDSNIPESNDFIFVDRKQDDPAPQNPLYPPVPGMPYPPNPNATPISLHHRPQPMNYLDGVPFQLSSQLCQEDSLEIVQLEVDGILALMTKRLQFDQADYEFTLEREISAQ